MADEKKYLDFDGLQYYHNSMKQYIADQFDDQVLTLSDIKDATVKNHSEEHLVTLTIAADGTLVDSSYEVEDLGIQVWAENENYNSFEAFSWPLDVAITDFDQKTIKVIYDETTYEGHPIKVEQQSGSWFYLFGSLLNDTIEPRDDGYEEYMDSGFADFPFKMFFMTSEDNDSREVALYWAWIPNDAQHTLNISSIEDSEKINPIYLPELPTPATSISQTDNGYATGAQVYAYIQSLQNTIDALEARIEELEEQMIVTNGTEQASNFGDIEPEDSSDDIITDYE